MDIEKLKNKKLLFKTAGGPVVTSAAWRTHRVDGACLGVYWYHVGSGRILWSNEHGAYHIDPDFLKRDCELFRLINKPVSQKKTREVMDAHPKEAAYREGWISGRIGRHDGKVYAFIYRNKIYAGKLTGASGAALISRLIEISGIKIKYLLDDEGYDLA
jgi:hypothetical protein